MSIPKTPNIKILKEEIIMPKFLKKIIENKERTNRYKSRVKV
tara:strand:+ start:822 stop:947 length:126 start_codon:yes stop_codon:yes gene_type:complete